MIRSLRWSLVVLCLVALIVQVSAFNFRNSRASIRSTVNALPSDDPTANDDTDSAIPMEGSIGDSEDIDSEQEQSAAPVPPFRPHPPDHRPNVPPMRPHPPPITPPHSTHPVGPERPNTHPVGPERPNTHPVGPEIPKPDIHPVGPERPNTHPVGPERPNTHPVGPERPNTHPVGPEIPPPNIHPVGPEVPPHIIPIGPEVPPEIHPVGPEVPPNIHPVGPEVPLPIHPVGPEREPHIRPVGPEVPPTIHPVGPEVPSEPLPIHPVGPEIPPHIKPVGPEVPPEIHPVGPEIPPEIHPVGPEIPPDSDHPQLGEGGEKLPPIAGGELQEDQESSLPVGRFANLVAKIRSHSLAKPKARIGGYVRAWREHHSNGREEVDPPQPLPRPPPQGGPAIPTPTPPPSNPPSPNDDAFDSTTVTVIDNIDGGEAVTVTLPADADSTEPYMVPGGDAIDVYDRDAPSDDPEWKNANIGNDPPPPPPPPTDTNGDGSGGHHGRHGIPPWVVLVGAILLIFTTVCYCVQRQKVKRVTAERDALRLQMQGGGGIPQQVYAIPVRMPLVSELNGVSPSNSQQPYVALPSSAPRVVAQPYQPSAAMMMSTNGTISAPPGNGFTAVGPSHGFAYPSLGYQRLPQQQEVGMQMTVQ